MRKLLPLSGSLNILLVFPNFSDLVSYRNELLLELVGAEFHHIQLRGKRNLFHDLRFLLGVALPKEADKMHRKIFGSTRNLRGLGVDGVAVERTRNASQSVMKCRNDAVPQVVDTSVDMAVQLEECFGAFHALLGLRGFSGEAKERKRRSQQDICQ